MSKRAEEKERIARRAPAEWSPSREAEPTLTPELFALAIKQHRERLGWTQGQAAEACRVSLRSIAAWESGQAKALVYPLTVGVLKILSDSSSKKTVALARPAH